MFCRCVGGVLGCVGGVLGGCLGVSTVLGVLEGCRYSIKVCWGVDTVLRCFGVCCRGVEVYVQYWGVLG